MNEFTTVFEISSGSNGIRAEALLRFGVGVVTFMIGIVWLVRSRKAASQEKWQWKGPAFVIVWAVVWLLVHIPFFRITTATMSWLIEACRTEQCKITEGIVHIIHQQPENGHAAGDKILVGGQSFEVNYYDFTPGYRQTISHGGALGEGVHARLHHLNGVILKVEIENHLPAQEVPGR